LLLADNLGSPLPKSLAKRLLLGASDLEIVTFLATEELSFRSEIDRANEN